VERYGDGAGPEHAGRLVKYTSVGCYPVYYLDNSGSAVVCASCANNDEDNGREPSAQGVNWEDSELFCDECGERIESAYAEGDAPVATTGSGYCKRCDYKLGVQNPNDTCDTCKLIK
jgi:hypothetical protein